MQRHVIAAATFISLSMLATPVAVSSVAERIELRDAEASTESDALADRLLEGVESIATGGNPASLVVWGDAIPLVVRDDGTLLAAAATLGDGRVVALGHGGYLGDERGDTPRFLGNVLKWLGEGGKGGDEWMRAGGASTEFLNRISDLTVRSVLHVKGRPGTLDLAETDVLIGSPQAWARAGREDELAAWIRGGGSMLVTETAWGQIQLGHASGVDDLAANRLLAGAGILFTADAESAGRGGTYEHAAELRPLAEAGRALRLLESGEGTNDQLRFASTVARDALAQVPLDGALVAAADAIRVRQDAAIDAAYRGMVDRPLRPAEQPLAIALMDLDARRAAESAPADVVAHASSDAFPGRVDPAYAAANAGVVAFDLDPSTPGWRSTGLYALPGEPVEVRFHGTWGEVAAASFAGIHLQIGVWRDPQNFPQRVRLPIGTTRVRVEDGTTSIASPIGGPVIIDLPVGIADVPNIGSPMSVTVTGAVPMPHYVHGETDLGAWRDEIRQRPVPWAELESGELVFTIPSEAIRGLDRPDLVMDHWDTVHATMQALEPRSPRHWPDGQYRYVAERKLSWGWMYCPANDPIVIPEVTAAAMVDFANFDAEGEHKVWGHYHEMGHAHQNPMWTFGGTVEVTVNIFTVLALHRVNGYPLDSEVMRSDPAKAWRTFVDHRAAGAPFDEWKRKPFLALQTYSMLWHEFGLEAFERCFRAYDEIPANERPRSDADKRDRFLIEMSRAVGRDLGPYFEAWGIPVRAAARERISDLEPWMPAPPRAPGG